ncbi:DUF1501 domain-containing protein [Marivivens sp. LCG002]|uniref:DUF1501 domain-containing protein n=1 Tax=Marivivens sp. LCG002 TaxID=3051171 RepID=UPI002557124D|nr:DUF1501 domain-containing protein [Marivivens sp. LCG002]WIV51378.1 DUF1501 domain-containing protein [Marivivens sp. LCG002]
MRRRDFLVGCSAAAAPFFTPVVMAEGPWEARIVVIILRGAMDGLDVVRPIGDPDYGWLRPTLSQQEGEIPLDDFWAMHQALAPLRPLWDRGQLGFAHAVSTPYRDRRSHFDGQDMLEAGGNDLVGRPRGGWLNRLVSAVPNATSRTAFAIGREEMLILDGEAPVSSWSPEAGLSLSPQARRLLARVYEGDPLFEQASADAIAIADQVSLGSGESAMVEGVNSGTEHAGLARFAAERLREETRIASFSLSGWDTHNGQSRDMGRALGRLCDTILTLRAELGPLWDKTAVMCLTEFGRTAAENGSRGTDHGTGGAMIYAGGALRGGQVITDWPGLSEADLYAGRDLMPTRDVRAYAGWMLRQLTGLPASVIETTLFPDLDLGADPKIVL